MWNRRILTFSMIVLGAILGWLAREHIELGNQQNAGGSATGNALEVAQGPGMQDAVLRMDDTLIKLQLAEPQSSATLKTDVPKPKSETPIVLSGLNALTSYERIETNYIDPDGDGLGTGSKLGMDPWEGRHDTIPGSLDSVQLLAWLKSRGIQYGRFLQIHPDEDLSRIDGGVKPGDLIVYRAGTYRSLSQIPSGKLQASPSAQLTLLAWPGERVVLHFPNPFRFEGASHWRLIGFEWNSYRPDTLGPILENTTGMLLEDQFLNAKSRFGLVAQGSRNLTLSGSLLKGTRIPLFINLGENTRIQGSILDGGSVHFSESKGDTLLLQNNIFLSDSAAMLFEKPKATIYLKDNLVIGSGLGCLRFIDTKGSLVLALGNSLWNRSPQNPAQYKDAIRIESLQQGTEFQFRQNLILDEPGHIQLQALNGVQFTGNRLFSKAQAVPRWLVNGNRIADPGFPVQQ